MGSTKIRNVIGIGGKYCAGKGVVSAYLAQKEYALIDVDRIGHQAIESNAAQIIACFGEGIVNSASTIDRKKLGEIVFGDAGALQKLEEIVHPDMKKEVARQVRALHPRNVAIDAALIYYLELDVLCNIVIWVRAPIVTRILRARARDRASLHIILNRIRSQRGLKVKPTNKDADTYIVNNSMSKDDVMRVLVRHVGIFL